MAEVCILLFACDFVSKVKQYVLQKSVANMSVDEVCVWLESIKLSKYTPSFRENEVSGKVLLELSDAALRYCCCLFVLFVVLCFLVSLLHFAFVLFVLVLRCVHSEIGVSALHQSKFKASFKDLVGLFVVFCHIHRLCCTASAPVSTTTTITGTTTSTTMSPSASFSIIQLSKNTPEFADVEDKFKATLNNQIICCRLCVCLCVCF